MKVGIVGATGYTGYELVKMLKRHSTARIGWLASETYAGQPYSAVYPCPYDDVLISPEAAPLDAVDLVFLCTPHHASAEWAARVLAAGTRCFDLSADFRLKDVATYEAFYGLHPVPELLPEAVYGLTEIYREQIAPARLVANSGCYPIGALLSLYPLLQKGLVRGERVIIDAKSGVSGAGAKPSPTTHFVAVHDNLSVYNVGRKHRHVPEIEQELTSYAGHPMVVTFTPTLLPVSRGILSTIYVSLDKELTVADVVALWKETYAGSPCVHVLPAGQTATLAHTVETSRVALSIAEAGLPGEYIIVTSLDNLLKGASGQAVQDMNVMFGFDETDGLIV
jgi:N-acetyl-gamma-glutamyl-phosphate reductase